MRLGLFLIALTALTSCKRVIGERAVIAPPCQVTGVLHPSARNRSYFEDPAGRIVLLTGSHTWNTIQDSDTSNPPRQFDYDEFLDFVQARGHNFVRLWSWEQSTGSADTRLPYFFSPMPYARTGPGTALDGKPRFDVSRFNDDYFRRLRSRVEQAQRKGLYVSIMLFNGWSIDDKGKQYGNPWKGHPYNAANNVNGVDADANADGQGTEVHTLQSPGITALQETYVKRLVDAVNDMDNVLYEISNESPAASAAWQYHMIRFVRAYEATKAKQHPIGMTALFTPDANPAVAQSPADWISPNGPESSPQDPPAADGAKVILDDTDHLCGICADAQWGWRSFTRGRNPIYMDVYDGGFALPELEHLDPHGRAIESMRRNLGHIRQYALRANLAKMTPAPSLASTGFLLADTSRSAGEYLAFVPGRTVTLDLSSTPARFAVEWFSPRLERVIHTDSITGGSKRTLRSPFIFGASVAYLHATSHQVSPSYCRPL